MTPIQAAERRDKIRRLHNKGVSPAVIAAMLGLTAHQVECSIGRYEQMKREGKPLRSGKRVRKADKRDERRAPRPFSHAVERKRTAPKPAASQAPEPAAPPPSAVSTARLPNPQAVLTPYASRSAPDIGGMAKMLKRLGAGPSPRQCQFIAGNDFVELIRQGGDPHCGKPCVEGAPYCAAHYARCYARPSYPGLLSGINSSGVVDRSKSLEITSSRFFARKKGGLLSIVTDAPSKNR